MLNTRKIPHFQVVNILLNANTLQLNLCWAILIDTQEKSLEFGKNKQEQTSYFKVVQYPSLVDQMNAGREHR